MLFEREGATKAETEAAMKERIERRQASLWSDKEADALASSEEGEGEEEGGGNPGRFDSANSVSTVGTAYTDTSLMSPTLSSAGSTGPLGELPLKLIASASLACGVGHKVVGTL